jgi:hypothetical protein
VDWIAKRIAEAKTTAPVVEGVAARVEAQLLGTMRERALRNSEFADLARDLLAAIEPQPRGTAP